MKMSNYEREHYMRELPLPSQTFSIERSRRTDINTISPDLATVVELEEKVPGMEWWYKFFEGIWR